MCKLSANQLSLYFSLISPELIEIELHGFKNEIFHHPGTILNKAHPLQTTYQNQTLPILIQSLSLFSLHA